MKTIKTYEGFFDFFKFSVKSKVEACKEVLKGKDYQMKKSPEFYRGTDEDYSDEFIFTYPYIVGGKECKVEIRLHDISYLPLEPNNLVNLTITGSGLGTVLDRQNQGIAQFNKNEFIDNLKRSIEACEKRIRVAVEAEEFFLEHPQEDIEDYLVDLKDELGEDIEIQKNYYVSCWDIHFSIYGANNFEKSKRLKDLVEVQISNLADLLDRVGLKLVQPEKNKLAKADGRGWISWFLQIKKK